jgi:hypothetical protein
MYLTALEGIAFGSSSRIANSEAARVGFGHSPTGGQSATGLNSDIVLAASFCTI